MSEVELAAIELPDFGQPTVQPAVPAATYAARVAAAAGRAAAAGLDALVVYADREHSANLAYLTGYDPRFEEALLILAPGRTPALLVGNEGESYAAITRVELDVVRYQSFSLLGQARDASPPLDEILRDHGIGGGGRFGVVGWKYFGAGEADAPETWLDAPGFIVDALRRIAGDPARVVNETVLFMDSSIGLRAINDVDQLACFEFAACHTSDAVRRALVALEPGISEFDLVRRMGLIGLPLSCHLMLSSGPRAAIGLCSPSSRVIEAGDPFTTAYGVWGALNCRAGFVVADAAGLPREIGDYVDRLVAPYFAAIAEWYETVGIGVPGGALFDVIDRRLGDPFFGIGLNPGHLLHLDEWVHSPIYRGSTETLKSGMALQVDVIPATRSRYFTTNIEDGIALADDALRESFAAGYPEAWARIQARRAFMSEALGIDLKPEVLPFSNIPAYLPPFLLDPGRAMRVRR